MIFKEKSIVINSDEINFIINTTEGQQTIKDSFAIRRNALQHNVCYTTTMAGGRASIEALRHSAEMEVYCLQSMHAELLDRAGMTTTKLGS